MEIVSGEAGGEGTEGAAGAAGAVEGGEQAPDLASQLAGLTTQLEGLSGLGGRLDELETRIQAGEEPVEETGEQEFVPQFSVEDYDEQGELSAEAQARAIREVTQRAVADALAPERAKQQEQRRVAYAEALEETYPDLADEAVQTEVFEAAEQRAAFLAQVTGRPELAELSLEPEFLELVYLEGQARKRSGSEVPAGSEREVQIEGGHGGASPADGSVTDEGDSIVARAQKSRFRLGSRG